ncbi:LOW QUALITY PROTEIN: regulatory protein, partial [Streptomyces filamentosus NRRL 11379]
MTGIGNLTAIHRYPVRPTAPHPTTPFTHFPLTCPLGELHLFPLPKIGGDEMRLRALLETDALGLRLLGGEDELDRTVRGVMTTDLRDPSRYLSGGELVLTGLAWRRDAADSEPFVRILAGAGVAGVAAGEAELGDIPADLVEACLHHRLPLFAVNETVAFATITEYVVRQVSGERAGDLAAVVDRHRRL